MSRTRKDLRDEVRAVLMEPSPGAMWTDAEIDTALNEGLRGLAEVSRVKKTSVVSVVDGVGTLPSDAFSFIRFYWEPTKTFLERWPYGLPPDLSSVGSPTHFLVMGLEVKVWPSASGNLHVSYWAVPALLLTDTSVVTLPEPDAVEDIIKAYAIAECKKKQGDPAWTQYDAKFQSLRAQYADRRYKATQGRFDVRDFGDIPLWSPFAWV